MGSILNDAICTSVMYCLVHLDHMIIDDIIANYKDLHARVISFSQPFHQFIVNISFRIQQECVVKTRIVYAVNTKDPLIGYPMLGPQY